MNRFAMAQLIFIYFFPLFFPAISAKQIDPPECPIFLTISPISRHLPDSPLEIHWGPRCRHPPEKISLFTSDPSITHDPPLLTIFTDKKPQGNFRTNVGIGHISLPGGWNQHEALANMPKRTISECFPFYLASFNGDKHGTSNCLKIRPNWMSEAHLDHIPLKQLFLPGTHCSGCYNHRTHPKSAILRRFGFVQNFDVWTQLVFGIRYLDVSVGFNADVNAHDGPNSFWLVNDSLFIASIIPFLQEIRKFAVVSGEVIIVDFSNFPLGFYQNPIRHRKFVKLLDQELGDIAFKRGAVNDSVSSDLLTLGDVKQSGKNVLLTYYEEQTVAEHELLWPTWRKFSSFHLKAAEMEDYVRKIFSRRFEQQAKDEAWVFYGVQGIDASYCPSLHLPSTRERANEINRNMSMWLSGAWAANANVVALDFFDGSNLIDTAISSNQFKRSKQSNYIAVDIVD